MFEVRNSQHSVGGLSKRDAWDDEFILKRHFSALIPAFDPRPGRTNVNQTSDIDIPPPPDDSILMTAQQTALTQRPSVHSFSPPGSTTEGELGGSQATEMHQPPKILLTLKGPSLPGSCAASHFPLVICVFNAEFLLTVNKCGSLRCLRRVRRVDGSIVDNVPCRPAAYAKV